MLALKNLQTATNVAGVEERTQDISIEVARHRAIYFFQMFEQFFERVS